MRARWCWLAGLLVAALTVAGCTGVPGASGPQPVRTIGLGEPQAPSAPAPPAGASPRAIVSGFLDAMAASPDRLDAARAYLDDEAAQRWSGSTVTVVEQQSLVVNDFQPNNTVQVSYQAIGALAADGVYSPTTSEALGVGVPQLATYSLARNSAGEWRIHTPPNGLFIREEDFDQRFTARTLYFVDSSGARLVPDLRYSPLAEPAVETFLLSQLAAGPRQELEGVASPFAPEPTGTQRLSVTPGAPTVAQIPGAAALDGDGRRQLAAQVAFTLRPSSFQSALRIQDGSQAVAVPGVGDTFEASDFEAFAPVTDPVTATYLRGGGVVDADGSPVSGAAGTTQYNLDNAVFDSDGGRTLVAGTTGPDGDSGARQLFVGDASALRDVGVPPGPLSAPAWAPIGTSADVDEIWVASGSYLYRYDPGQSGSQPTLVPIAGQVSLNGTVASLAFSSEGSRLALVVRAADGTSALFVASVLRNGPDVQLGQPEQLTPSGYQLTDAGWRSETLLAAVGTSTSFPAGVYLEVAVDGSRLRPSSTEGLPDRPRALAVSPRSSQQWVTTGSGGDALVWTRTSSLSSWARPSGSSQVGYAPAFPT